VNVVLVSGEPRAGVRTRGPGAARRAGLHRRAGGAGASAGPDPARLPRQLAPRPV